VVEAAQLTEENLLEVAAWCEGTIIYGHSLPRLYISTPEGNRVVHIGEFVVHAASGGFRKMKADYFNNNFDMIGAVL
jgi:hypothetical protein